MTLDHVLKLHRNGDKMAMALKKRMIDDELSPEESRDTLTRRVKDAVRAQDWEGAAACLTLLWFQDWRDHLGRDFAMHGEEPEHAMATAATFRPSEETTPSGEVVRFPSPSRLTDNEGQ